MAASAGGEEESATATETRAAFAAWVTSGVAHWPQNFASELFAEPHAEQRTASGAAHSLQNLRSGSFWVEQIEQITMTPFDANRRDLTKRSRRRRSTEPAKYRRGAVAVTWEQERSAVPRDPVSGAVGPY